MDTIQISAKKLGKMAMPDFCPRCFYVELHVKKLPYGIFPGIFSSLDSYTKKIVHQWIDRTAEDGATEFPDFLSDYGVTGYQKAPHWTKFRYDTGFGIVLSGIADDIWTVLKGIVVPDYKTAKFTENADKLLPMYRVQNNGYAKIAEATGMGPVVAIPLIYMEPQTENTDAQMGSRPESDLFKMTFIPHVLEIELDPDSLDPLLERARKIYDGPIPERNGECGDCIALDRIMEMVEDSESE